MSHDMSTRDIGGSPAVLSGGIGTLESAADNSYHVLKNNSGGINQTAVLDGFTINGGNADYLGDDAKGGGLFNKNASPTILRCSFDGNHAGFGGGGIYNHNSKPDVGHCSFTNNSAQVGGGAANYSGSSARYTNCHFEENAAQIGGAIGNNVSTANVTACYFHNNSATNTGGAIFNIASSPDIFNSVFTGNTADEGSAIGNIAAASPNITNCSFHGNDAGTEGGAIRNATNCTPAITNCILWGNGTEITDSPPGAVVTYSIVEQASGTYPGTGNWNADPLFTSATDLRLSSCSPAIDAGLNSANPMLSDLTETTGKWMPMGMGRPSLTWGLMNFRTASCCPASGRAAALMTTGTTLPTGTGRGTGQMPERRGTCRAFGNCTGQRGRAGQDTGGGNWF